MIRNEREDLKRIRLKLLMYGKVISTNFLMYTTDNKERNLKSIPQNSGKPEVKRPLGRPKRLWMIILKGIFER